MRTMWESGPAARAEPRFFGPPCPKGYWCPAPGEEPRGLALRGGGQGVGVDRRRGECDGVGIC